MQAHAELLDFFAQCSDSSEEDGKSDKSGRVECLVDEGGIKATCLLEDNQRKSHVNN